MTAPFAGREIRSEELLAARDAVTLLYVERGFITSGAVIPDQEVADGHEQVAVSVSIDVEGSRRPRSATGWCSGTRT